MVCINMRLNPAFLYFELVFFFYTRSKYKNGEIFGSLIVNIFVFQRTPVIRIAVVVIVWQRA
jgi:hypothetical protein